MNMQRFFWIFLSLLFLSPKAQGEEQYTEPLYVGNHFATGTRLPVCGDFDNDGQTDLACVFTGGKSIIDLSLMSKGLKFHRHRAVVRAVGGETVLALAGSFIGTKGSDIAIFLKDGRLFLAHSLSGSSMSLTLMGSFKEILTDLKTLRLRRIKGVKDAPDDLVVTGPKTWSRFRFKGKKAQVSHHKVGELSLVKDPVRPKGLKAEALIRSGDFNGDEVEDVLAFNCGSHRYSRKDLHLYLGVSSAKDVKDHDGDGLSDKQEKKLGSNPYDLDSDDDGLLDGWEVNGYKDLDLAAMGCSPTRQDVVVYLQRWSDVDGARVAKEWKRIVDYYAKLPVKNVKGPGGIGMHGLFLPVLKRGTEKKTHWRDLGNAYLPKTARGLAHYMVVGPGGGGQSSLWGTMGGCGVRAFYAVFIHEFGHQLGLSHTGGDRPAWCPVYPSLMNYAYSYSLKGKRRNISYSYGRLANHVLREDQLREVLPFAYKDVDFLAHSPYRYRLKKVGPKKTLIDWNRNGQFDKGIIQADINCGYSTTAGKRHTLGKTKSAPVLVSVKEKVYLLWLTEKKELAGRHYKGGVNWGKTESLGRYDCVGEPTGIGFDGQMILAIPEQEGVVILAGREPKSLKRAYLLPKSKGAAVSLTVYGGRCYALLWDSKNKEIELLELGPKAVASRTVLPIKSDIAPGACEDPVEGDLIVGVAGYVNKRSHRWKVARLFKEERAGWMLRSETWVEGKKGRAAGSLRPLLIFETGANAGPSGRLHWLAPGIISKKNPRSCFYDAMSLGDKNYHSGWLVKRYYDEWTRTRSPLGAVMHKGEVLLAYRWDGGGAKKNNRLQVGHRGLGIDKEPMSDHNDVEVISKFGLNHSIRWMGQWDSLKPQAKK
ncbi:MAG: hypothetical protein P1V97_14785 [Planctomycetota bacterium]|nr:hypothetical protein [Planctomycetota bacterium]